MRRSSFALVLVAILGGTLPLSAQQPPPQPRTFLTLDGKEPKRPRIDAGADTNDARAYVEWAHLRSTPVRKRFDAFWWAFRLEPAVQAYRLNMWESIFYAMPWEWRYERASGAGFVVNSRESKLLDSLDRLVYYREPFANLFARTCYIDWDFLEQVKREPYWVAWHYHANGCYQQAAEAWPKYLATRPGDLGARLDLVRAYHWTGQYGNALREIDITLDSLRARDAGRTYRFLISREMLETMRGEIHDAQEDYFNAKKAYGKALEENLTYWPAHVRLARAALRQNETPEALQEYEQALQLAPDEATVHFDYGVALLHADRPADAEREFRLALAREPFWAQPYMNLAMAIDRQGRKDEALATYRDYVARAPKYQNRLINLARQRIAVLGGTMTAEAK